MWGWPHSCEAAVTHRAGHSGPSGLHCRGFGGLPPSGRGRQPTVTAWVEVGRVGRDDPGLGDLRKYARDAERRARAKSNPSKLRLRRRVATLTQAALVAIVNRWTSDNAQHTHAGVRFYLAGPWPKPLDTTCGLRYTRCMGVVHANVETRRVPFSRLNSRALIEYTHNTCVGLRWFKAYRFRYRRRNYYMIWHCKRRSGLFAFAGCYRMVQAESPQAAIEQAIAEYL